MLWGSSEWLSYVLIVREGSASDGQIIPIEILVEKGKGDESKEDEEAIRKAKTIEAALDSAKPGREFVLYREVKMYG